MFEDACALGKSADVDDDFTLSTAELPGFRRLVDQPTEWVRLTTALIDYAAFMSNSDMQAAYSKQNSVLDLLRMSDFSSPPSSSLMTLNKTFAAPFTRVLPVLGARRSTSSTEA